MTELIPDFQDTVKHKTEGSQGVVIATYLKDNVPYLDVRMEYDKIVYSTPRANWEVVSVVDE